MAKTCREQLIAQGFVYNEVYGWEKPEVLESFGLNPNMKGVPFSHQKQWVQASGGGKDSFGNKIKVDDTGGEWVRSEKKYVWYPTEGWLLYYKSKVQKIRQEMADGLNNPTILDEYN